VVPLFERHELQLVHLSSQALSAVRGRAPGHRGLSGFVPGFWLLFALAGVSLLLVSVGQLLIRRRALRRRLAAAADRPFPRRRELEEMLEEIYSTRHLPPLRLALRKGPPGDAGSERICVWRAERYVEISEGCLDLPAAQLKAALAHECAHHYLKHLAVRSFALWLGRLSLTGDGFVFALLDSFGYEKQADRAAVGPLGAPRGGLIELLQRLSQGGPGPEVSPMTSLNPSLSDRWSLFLEQYCGGLKHHYWHPVAQERIEALCELE
jgi:Zn-dependent protease with chaperone function